MKKHLSTIALILVLLAGVSLLLYPTVSDYWNARHASKAVADYTQNVQALDQDAYDELLAAAEDYNRSLLTRENGFFLTEEQQAQYESLLDISGTGIMGYIEIPSINVSLPIYHGTAIPFCKSRSDIWTGQVSRSAAKAHTASSPAIADCPAQSCLPISIRLSKAIRSSSACSTRF